MHPALGEQLLHALGAHGLSRTGAAAVDQKVASVLERLKGVAVHVEHELDVATGNAQRSREQVHDLPSVVAKGRPVDAHERLLVRKADVRRALVRLRVLGVHLVPAVARAQPRGDLPRLLERLLESHVCDVVVSRWDELARLLSPVRVLKALQPELDARRRRPGVLRLPLARRVFRGEDFHRARLSVVVAAPQLGALQLVVLVDHRVHLLLLDRNVALDLAHGEDPHVALLALRRLAVGAALDRGVLGRALVDAVNREQVRLEHRAAQPLLVRVEVVLAMKEREHAVAVLLERGQPLLLRLDEDRVAVLVQLPVLAQQDLVGLDVAVHLLGQRRAEDVLDARVVAHVAPAHVLDVLRRIKVLRGTVVPQARIHERRVQVDRHSALVECARDRNVAARVVRRRLLEALVVVRDRRTEGVHPAVLLVLGEGVGGAPRWRVAPDVRVVRPPLVAVCRAAHALHEAEPVLVVADAARLQLRRRFEVVVVDLRALQLVLPLEPAVALVLGHAVDQPVGLDLGVLLHDLAHEQVGREALVEDEHQDFEAHVLPLAIVHSNVHVAEHHRRLPALVLVDVVRVRAVRVRSDGPVEPALQL